jgi:hypothetical protein
MGVYSDTVSSLLKRGIRNIEGRYSEGLLYPGIHNVEFQFYVRFAKGRRDRTSNLPDSEMEMFKLYFGQFRPLIACSQDIEPKRSLE